MSITSFFVFNKVKNHLKKNNLDLKEFLFFDKNKMIINIDNKELKINEKIDNILNEMNTKDIEKVSQVLITKNNIKIKMNDGTIYNI